MSEAKRRSPEEQLSELERKIEQLKARKQQLQSKISQKERKERTRRLIQVGAILEKHFPEFVGLPLEKVSDAVIELRQLVVERNEKARKEQGGGAPN